MSEAALPTAHRRSSGNRAVFILAGITAVLFVILILGLALGTRGWDVAILGLALVTAFVGLLPIVLDSGRSPEKRQLMISILGFTYMIFLVVPVFTNYFLVKGEDLPGMFNLIDRLPTEIVTAQIAALSGILMLLVGFYAPFGRIAASAIPQPTRDWSPNAALVVGLITVGLGWLVYGPSMLGLVPRRLGSGVLGAVAAGSYFGIALLTLTWLRYRRRKVVLLLLVIVPLAMLVNFFRDSKQATLTSPAMIALAFILYERRVRKVWVLGALAAIIVLYPVAQFYRDYMGQFSQPSLLAFVQNPLEVLSALSSFTETSTSDSYLYTGLVSTGRRLDALGVLTVILRDTPDRVPFQNGRTIGLIFVSYIPRILWAGKPGTSVGAWVSQSYGSPWDLQTHIGPSWIGEFYFNFGYPGILIGMFALGVMCRALQEKLFGVNAPLPALFGAVVALFAVCRSVQGGLLGPVNGVVYHLPPIALAHVFVGIFGGFAVARTRARRMPAGANSADPAGNPT